MLGTPQKVQEAWEVCCCSPRTHRSHTTHTPRTRAHTRQEGKCINVKHKSGGYYGAFVTKVQPDGKYQVIYPGVRTHTHAHTHAHTRTHTRTHTHTHARTHAHTGLLFRGRGGHDRRRPQRHPPATDQWQNIGKSRPVCDTPSASRSLTHSLACCLSTRLHAAGAASHTTSQPQPHTVWPTPSVSRSHAVSQPQPRRQSAAASHTD